MQRLALRSLRNLPRVNTQRSIITTKFSSKSVNARSQLYRLYIQEHTFSTKNEKQSESESEEVDDKDLTEKEIEAASEELDIETNPLESEPAAAEKVIHTESVVGDASNHEFLSETRKLLDIVAKSLYTDKKVSFNSIFEQKKKEFFKIFSI